METKEMLKKEIEFLTEKVHNLTPGTKEHSEATEALCKLNKAMLDCESAELAREKHEEEVKLSDRREANAEVKYEEDRALELSKQRDMRIKMAVDGGIALLGLGINIAGWIFYKNRFHEMLIYEEKGSISSQAGRNVIQFMNRLLDSKK